MTQKLFIGGLSFSTSSDRLREFFSQVEGVQSASVVTDRDTVQSRGFGFVEMASTEAATAASSSAVLYSCGQLCTRRCWSL